MFLKRVLYYLNPATLFRKPQGPDATGGNDNMNLRFMHGINRISIFLFLFCLGLMVWRACAR